MGKEEGVGSDLFLFEVLCYLAAGFLMGTEQADHAGFIWVQDVPIYISDHQIQL